MNHFLAMRKSYALASARGGCDSVPNLGPAQGPGARVSTARDRARGPSPPGCPVASQAHRPSGQRPQPAHQTAHAFVGSVAVQGPEGHPDVAPPVHAEGVPRDHREAVIGYQATYQIHRR